MQLAKDKYPELAYLMEGYFHQMWIDINQSRGLVPPNDYRHALDFFLSQEKLEVIAQATSEFSLLIQADLSEKELKSLIWDKLNGSIDPLSRGMTYREWLVEVRDYLQAGLKK